MTKLSNQVRQAAQAIADDETRNGAMYDRRCDEWDNTALAASVGGGSHSGISDPTAKAALRPSKRSLKGVRRLALIQLRQAAENLRKVNAELATAIDDPMIEVLCDNTACLEPVWVLTSDTTKAKAPPLCDGCTLGYKRSGQLPDTEQVAARNRVRKHRQTPAN